MNALRHPILTTLLLGGLLLPALPGSAQGQRRSDKLLQLLKARPRGMKVDTWREQRREAVRELGRLKERRAVPPLLRIIDKERFDVILEIAIDALGQIGDRRAVGPLKRLLDDPSLDAYVRDAAAGSLKKLSGRSGTTTGTSGRPRPRTTPRSTTAPTPTPTPARPAGVSSATNQATGAFAKLPELKLPELGVNVIARSTRMDLVVGAGHYRWDGRTDRSSAGFTLLSRYRRQLEAKRVGYTIDAAADFSFDLDTPPSGDSSWQIGHHLQLNPEIRFYPFSRDVPLLFGQLSGGFGYGLGVSRVPATPDKRVAFAGTLSAGGGPGYGRVVDIGPRLRMARVARVLRKAGAIEGDLDPTIGTKIIQAWYELRNRIGSYQRLGQTLRLLRKADLLAKGRLDPAVVYRLIRILDDPQLQDRFEGFMFRAGYGYARSLVKDNDDVTLAYAYATASLQHQRGTTRGLGADLRFFYNMWGTPDTYNVQLTGHYAWYLYNRAFDPLGAIEASFSAGLNNQAGAAFEGGGLAYNALLGVSYARFFSRGARMVAGLRGGMENNAAVVMFTIEGQYGIARGAFVVDK